jgi:hypothetical protein
MKSAVIVFPGINRERDMAPVRKACQGILFALWLFVPPTTAAWGADDITQQVGKEFSLFSSGNCRRVEHATLDLVLDCQFGGKRAQFYLKEFRNSRLPINPSEDSEPIVNSALANVVREIESPDMIERIKLSGGSSYGAVGGGMILNRFGFRYKSVEDAHRLSQDFEKRVVFRAHWVAEFGMAALVVISDFDPAALREISRGVPAEVTTMLVSLGMKDDRLPPP